MKAKEHSIEAVTKAICSMNPKIRGKTIRKGFEFIKKTNKETLYHSERIALLLAGMGLGEETITAGILHNALEVNSDRREELRREFGEKTLHLVEGLAKTNFVFLQNRNRASDKALSKIILAIAEDIRVLFLRLSEHLAYLEKPVNREGFDKTSLAKSAREIFTPIASKLGLTELSWKLQDLSMKTLERNEYYEIKEMVKEKREEREKKLGAIMKKIRKELKAKGIKARLFGRVKNFYGIRQKMLKKRRPFEEIHDLLAVRVICSSIKDCYIALGAVHELFEPISEYFDDYIAKPKPNGYRSIHSDVKTKKGQIFEVQIRTWEMHSDAEGGVAAHWAYKEFSKDQDFDTRLNWTKQLIEWSKGTKGKKGLMESLKLDFEARKIFVLTPKGKVVELDAGSTPIDFAYSIHSDIGNHAEKAKINGKVAPLDYELQNGDVVEIITSAKQQPKRAWLQFVKTAKARAKIKSKLQIKVLTKKIKEKLFEKKVIERAPKKKAQVSLSLCCNPVPGDKIIAYQTTKRKIKIHRNDCLNAKKLFDSKRIVSVDWKSISGNSFETAIKVRAMDRANLLTDLLNIIAKNKARIINANASIEKQGTVCNFSIKVKNKEAIERIMENMYSVKGVHEVSRA